MKKHWSITVVTGCCLALFALRCNQKQQSAPDTRAADETTIRGISPAWFKAFNAGDVNSLVALYAEDAVVSAPGAPAARGQVAMREFFTKDVAASATAGMTLNGGTTTDAGVSGDLGWE